MMVVIIIFIIIKLSIQASWESASDEPVPQPDWLAKPRAHSHRQVGAAENTVVVMVMVMVMGCLMMVMVFLVCWTVFATDFKILSS